MHFLSIIAMFKNESYIIEQWIQHYLLEGVNHFYLIDNGSTDDYESKIEKYNKKITLIKDSYRQENGTQNVLINKHFLSKIKKESQWVIICDIDEYIYHTDNNKKISNFLIDNEKYCRIWIPWKLFGACKNPDIIPNLINNLTYRHDKINITNNGYGKSIIKCEKLIILETHYSTVNGDTLKLNLTYDLHCNHYKLISEKYFKEIKSIRGGGQSGLSQNYNFTHFLKENKLYNDIIDDSLKNKIIYLKNNFNYNSYKTKYKDLSTMKDNQLWEHFIKYGIVENRKP
jgi:hypothetical protein